MYYLWPSLTMQKPQQRLKRLQQFTTAYTTMFRLCATMHDKKSYENNGRVAFIGIVIHNHFVLPMSLFIDFDVSLPKPGSFFRTIFGSAAFAVTKR